MRFEFLICLVIFTIIASVAAYHDISCGASSKTHCYNTVRSHDKTRIVNGEPACAGQMPFQAAIFRERDGVSKFRCGGVIIDEYHVLTAAHCLTEKRSAVPLWSDEISVFVGLHDKRVSQLKRGAQFGVKNMAVHEEYATGGVDIGILELDSKLSWNLTTKGHGDVNRICLPAANQNYEDEERVLISGWGMDENFQRQDMLQFVETTLRRTSSCGRRENPREICIGTDGRGHNTGDSGGPIFRLLDDERAELVAVVSRRPYKPPIWIGIEPKVSEFIPWIKEKIASFREIAPIDEEENAEA